MSLPVGARLGPYEIVSLIGAGGMGEVYRALDPRLGREVAIKVLPQGVAADSTARSRFEREARAVAALSHPNILSIHDFGLQQDICYAVMEYLSGESLRERIRRGAIPWIETWKIALDLCEGLSAAHAKGIVHRDLKPDNIFVTHDGRIKILDFGLAVYEPQMQRGLISTSTPTATRVTEAGGLLGTVPYMSPQQARGEILDARSDVFSLGCVLFEMLTGRQAFAGPTTADVLSAILNREPAVPDPSLQIPPDLLAVIRRCLSKEPENRPQSARELETELRSIQEWAQREAIPDILKLVDQENYYQAYELAKKAEELLPDDSNLAAIRVKYSRLVNIHSGPEGARVFVKEYGNLAADWQYLGQTPMTQVRIPAGLMRMRVELEGYDSLELAEGFPQFKIPTEVGEFLFKLDKIGSISPGMVRVPGGEFALQMPGLDHLAPVLLHDYLMDRAEVTNKQYREFMKLGGYSKREYWKQPFVKDGRELPWEVAMKEFRDGTGRPGPAGWEIGEYPKGQEDWPVTGVSWYEASAYAEFAGKSLPTIYHWNRAAGTWDSPYILPLSNFSGQGLAPVGTSGALHHYGTYDMAGNAKEWCWNEGNDKRFILGGAWNEPQYMFNDADAQAPFSRLSTYGFRCVKYLEAPTDATQAPIDWIHRDFRNEKRASDEVFEIYRSLYSYDKAPLHPIIESEDVVPEQWTMQRISFNAAYGQERMAAYLFLPANVPPPYQTLVYFPGSMVLYLRSAEDFHRDVRNRSRIDYVVQTGRAVLYPVYQSTFERGDELNSDVPNSTSLYRDHVIQWSKDFGRSIDYLETRQDIDTSKLGFIGSSWGGTLGPILTALDARVKVNIFLLGGLNLQKSLPEADPIHFISRVTIPTLMLSGRYDFFFPTDVAQAAYDLLGTSPEHKRHVFYDTGHDIPRNEMIREVLNWLERYLGPV